VTDCLLVKRALVLGGGGVVGIAWEVGVLTGLAQEGFDLTGPLSPEGHQPQAIVGTSAGSMVGALLATHTLDDLADLSTRDDRAAVIMETVPLLDFALMTDCFTAWKQITESTPAMLKPVCDFALATNTISEERFVESFAEVLDSEWRDPRFSCIAVNTSTAERVQWTHTSGVPIARAVASSCSVPSIFPSVALTTNNGTAKYTDGGVYSGTSLDLLAGVERVLVLAPIGSFPGDTLDASAADILAQETAFVKATGTSVVRLFTDDETNEATLQTPLTRMDPSMRQPALDHGIRQGRALAAQLRGWW
jgi:NTE family protein